MKLFTVNNDRSRAACSQAMEEFGVFFWVRTPEELEAEAERPYHAGGAAMNRAWRPGEEAAVRAAAQRAREILADPKVEFVELDL